MMKSVTVLPHPTNTSTPSVQSELYSRLQFATAQLKEESERIHANMERTLFRLMTQGPSVCLEGITLGRRWESLVAEITAVQETLQSLEDLE